MSEHGLGEETTHSFSRVCWTESAVGASTIIPFKHVGFWSMHCQQIPPPTHPLLRILLNCNANSTHAHTHSHWRDRCVGVCWKAEMSRRLFSLWVFFFLFFSSQFAEHYCHEIPHSDRSPVCLMPGQMDSSSHPFLPHRVEWVPAGGCDASPTLSIRPNIAHRCAATTHTLQSAEITCQISRFVTWVKNGSSPLNHCKLNCIVFVRVSVCLLIILWALVAML